MLQTFFYNYIPLGNTIHYKEQMIRFLGMYVIDFYDYMAVSSWEKEIPV